MRKGKIIVASMMVLCVLIFVAAAAWFMLFQGEMTEPTEEEKQAAILHAAGLMKSETQDKKSVETLGNDSNLLIVFYVQIMPDDFVMQLHRF